MQIIRETIEALKEQYFADNRPWVVTYSEGKDSACMLQLTMMILQELYAERCDYKHIYVISSDTAVKMPIR